MTDQTQLIPGNTLLTNSPEEGRALAVKMARLIIKITQPDPEVREKLRPKYANDAAMLIAIGQTLATEFATIAKANDYWKQEVKYSVSDLSCLFYNNRLRPSLLKFSL